MRTSRAVRPIGFTKIHTQPGPDMLGESLRAHRLAGLGPAYLHGAGPARCRAKVMVKTDHTVHLGPGQVEGGCYGGNPGSGNKTFYILDRVQQGQQPARFACEAADAIGY